MGIYFFVPRQLPTWRQALHYGSSRRGNLGDTSPFHAEYYGWNDAWLSPEFRDWSIERELESIAAPVMIIQGTADQYGTMRQIEIAKARLKSSLSVEMLPGIGHNPMREAEGETLRLITKFIYENNPLHMN